MWPHHKIGGKNKTLVWHIHNIDIKASQTGLWIKDTFIFAGAENVSILRISVKLKRIIRWAQSSNAMDISHLTKTQQVSAKHEKEEIPPYRKENTRPQDRITEWFKWQQQSYAWSVPPTATCMTLSRYHNIPTDFIRSQ
jgi:hypothetical protein